MRFASIYAVVVGVLIVAQWAFFLVSGSVPELQTAPWSIGLHLAAELVLAVALVTGGVAVWNGKEWGRVILPVGLGMAIYSEIASSGYFAQQEMWALVIMFAILLVAALASIRALNTQTKE